MLKSIRISEDNWKRIMQLKLIKDFKTADDVIDELFDVYVTEEKVKQ